MLQLDRNGITDTLTDTLTDDLGTRKDEVKLRIVVAEISSNLLL